MSQAQAQSPSGINSAGGLTYPYNLSFQSNASVAIIIVVLGATFFFMFLFLVYIKRCGGEQQQQNPGAAGRGGGGSNWNAIHGLDPEVLKKFPIMSYGSVKHKAAPPARDAAECAVCLGQFEESERLRLLPACGHSFHPECIDMWLETHSTCPLCRRSLDHDDAEIDAQQAAADAQQATTADAQQGTAATADAQQATTADAQEGDLQQPAAAQQEQANNTVVIIRTLSRNSESFKSAAHEAELREVRERLRATSGRFAGGSSTPSSPSPLVRLLSRGGGSPSSRAGGSCHGSSKPPIPPSVAMATIHHSQSCSDLAIARSNAPEMTTHQRDGDDLEAGLRLDRWPAAGLHQSPLH